MIPIFYAGASVVSFFVRGVVFIASLFGTATDPLPPDRGPQFPNVSNASTNDAWEPVAEIDNSDLRNATVMLTNDHDGQERQGSGVCIHPDGFILTAEHVISTGKCKVHFHNREPIEGTVIRSKLDGFDGAALISCTGKDFPYLRVASSIPARGSPLSCAGMHAGNYVTLNGMLAGVAPNVDYRGRSFFKFSFSAMAGMSGGPVVNADNEVVSLITNSNTRDSWGLPYENVAEVASFAPQLEQPYTKEVSLLPTLQVYTSESCPPCRLFKAHFAPGTPAHTALHSYYNVEYIDVDRDRAKAAKAGITSIPTFLIPSQNQRIVGYSYPNAAVFLDIIRPNQTQPPIFYHADDNLHALPLPPEPHVTPHVPSLPESAPAPEESIEEKGFIGRLRESMGDFFGGIIGAAFVLLATQYHKWSAYKAEQSLLKRIALNKTEAKVRAKVQDTLEDHPTFQSIANQARSYIKR